MSIAQNTDLLIPVEIWEVPLGNSTIKFHKPLVLTPTFIPDDPEEPDDNEYLQVDYPKLAISSFGRRASDCSNSSCFTALSSM